MNGTFKKILTVTAAVCAAFLISLVVAIPKASSFYVELGDAVPDSPSDYLFGYRFMLKDAEVDISQVNSDAVGSYQAYANFLFWRYTLPVEVGDKTPPVIELPEGTIYVAANRIYEPVNFVNHIYDLSGEVQSTVTYDGTVYDSISFEQLGDYTAVITSTDIWGNTISQEIAFTVDDAPMIIGAFDRHIAVGSQFNLGDVVAADSTDGILTDRIELTVGSFDPNTVGDYEVTYTVSDNYGLKTSATVTLSVVDSRQLSSYHDDLTLTTPELNLLCGLHYFAYEPLAEENYDAAVKLIEPTLVDLKRVWNDGSWGAGSGAIYQITPEYVYLISVEHVTKEVSKDCHIMFFDGEVLSGSFQYITSDEKNEMVMFAVRTADIPADTLLALRQLYVDMEIYSKLNLGDKVVGYAKHWNGTDKDLIRPMEIKALTSSIKTFGFIDSLLETTQNVTNGMSGTAIVDYKGNLVGLASAAGPSMSGGTALSAYHSKIDVLPELWQKINDSLAA